MDSKTGRGWNRLAILDYLDEEASAFLCSCGCWRLGNLCHRYQYGAWLGLLQPHDFWVHYRSEGNELIFCAGGHMIVWTDTLAAYSAGLSYSVWRVLRSWKRKAWITISRCGRMPISAVPEMVNSSGNSFDPSVKASRQNNDYMDIAQGTVTLSRQMSLRPKAWLQEASSWASQKLLWKNYPNKQEMVALKNWRKTSHLFAELGLAWWNTVPEKQIRMGVGAKSLHALSLSNSVCQPLLGEKPLNFLTFMI